MGMLCKKLIDLFLRKPLLEMVKLNASWLTEKSIYSVYSMDVVTGLVVGWDQLSVDTEHIQ